VSGVGPKSVCECGVGVKLRGRGEGFGGGVWVGNDGSVKSVYAGGGVIGLD
jgi:hypothetical protein